MSGPSHAAQTAARAKWRETQQFGDAVLLAAHDPALGLDRSVCLRDVLRWMRSEEHRYKAVDDAADFMEREFGGGS